MKRFIALTVAAALAAWIPASASTATLAPSDLNCTNVIDSEIGSETANGCCWTYILGRWVCMAC